MFSEENFEKEEEEDWWRWSFFYLDFIHTHIFLQETDDSLLKLIRITYYISAYYFHISSSQ